MRGEHIYGWGRKLSLVPIFTRDMYGHVSGTYTVHGVCKPGLI